MSGVRGMRRKDWGPGCPHRSGSKEASRWKRGFRYGLDGVALDPNATTEHAVGYWAGVATARDRKKARR